MQNQNSIASFRNVEEVDQAIEEEEKKIQAIRERQRILRMHRNALTPACKLPPEVLSMIFALCAPYRGNLSLAFSQVCHHWRISSLGDPTIWRSPTFFYPRLAAYMIERAQSTPLRIQEDCAGYDQWFQALRDAMLHSLVEHLEVQADSKQLTALMELLPRSVATLKRVKLVLSGNAPLLLKEDTKPHEYPHLRFLSLSRCMLTWDSACFTNLTSLDINLQGVAIHRLGQDAHPSRLVSMLQRNPNLQTLSLDMAMQRTDVSRTLDGTFKPGASARILLHNLKKLRLRDSLSNMNFVLAALECPSLSELNIDCGYEEDPSYVRRSAPELLRNISSSASAESIDVLDLTYRPGHSNIDFEALCDTAGIPGRRDDSFSLRLTLRFGSSHYESEDLKLLYKGELVQLFSMQRLEKLTIEAWVENAPECEIFARLPSITELRTKGFVYSDIIKVIYSATSKKEEVRSFPALRTLHIEQTFSGSYIDPESSAATSNSDDHKPIPILQALLVSMQRRQERGLLVPKIFLHDCAMFIQSDDGRVSEGNDDAVLYRDLDTGQYEFKTVNGQPVVVDFL